MHPFFYGKNMTIWVDADACPSAIKEIICRASLRTGLASIFVSNHYISLPKSTHIRHLQVEKGFDVADNAIVERIDSEQMLITSDIPLADQVLAKHSSVKVINYQGELLTQNNIKQRLAMRNLMQSLRDDYALQTGRNAAYSQTQSKRFADVFNRVIDQMKRKANE